MKSYKAPSVTLHLGDDNGTRYYMPQKYTGFWIVAFIAAIVLIFSAVVILSHFGITIVL